MDRTPTSQSHLAKVRDLTHRGVDTVFDGAEIVLALAPSIRPPGIRPERLTTAAGRFGRSVAGRVLPFPQRGSEGEPGTLRQVPPGPDVVTPAEPVAPAADGAAAARAERRRPRPAAPLRPAEPPPLAEPDELVYSTGGDNGQQGPDTGR